MKKQPGFILFYILMLGTQLSGWPVQSQTAVPVLVRPKAASTRVAVPAIVSANFVRKYPDARNTRWFFRKGRFVAMFQLETKANKIVYNTLGSVLMSEVQMADSLLPLLTRRYLQQTYALFAIRNTMRTEDMNGQVGYHLWLQKSKPVALKEVFFDSYGMCVTEPHLN